MPITIDLDADLSYVDGVTSATVRLNRPNATHEFTTTLAVMGDLSHALRSFGSVELLGKETAWHLPDLLTAGERLGPDDEIIAGGVTYAVVDAVRIVLGAGWVAIARPRPGGA